MTKTVEQQALEFVKKWANVRYADIPINFGEQAQAIVDQICDHTKIKKNQYCHLCGEKNGGDKNCGSCGGAGRVCVIAGKTKSGYRCVECGGTGYES